MDGFKQAVAYGDVFGVCGANFDKGVATVFVSRKRDVADFHMGEFAVGEAHEASGRTFVYGVASLGQVYLVVVDCEQVVVVIAVVAEFEAWHGFAKSVVEVYRIALAALVVGEVGGGEFYFSVGDFFYFRFNSNVF